MDERVVVVKKGAVGSFLQGVILGAAIALLVAPRSGKETRDMLSERGNEIRDKAAELAKDTRDRAQTYISDARNKIGDTMQGAKEGMKQAVSPEQSEENLKGEVNQLKRDLSIEEDINNPNFPL